MTTTGSPNPSPRLAAVALGATAFPPVGDVVTQPEARWLDTIRALLWAWTTYIALATIFLVAVTAWWCALLLPTFTAGMALWTYRTRGRRRNAAGGVS